MEKPKLWIVTELFYPDQTSTSYILSKIANKMVEKYNVTVFTDSSLYQEEEVSKDVLFEISNDIEIVRIPSKKKDKNDLLQRFKKMTFVSARITKLLFEKTRKGEKVLVVTNPAPMLVLVSLIKWIRKINLTILVHDIFPENTIPAGIIKSKKSFLYKLLLHIFNRAYSNADCLIAIGRDMKEVLDGKLRKNRSRKMVIIENWADTINIKPAIVRPLLLEERISKGGLTIQYAGNIGRTQGLEAFLELLNRSSNKNIFFDLWGNGALKQDLKKKIEEINMTDRVYIYGGYSRAQQNRILNSANLALVTLAEGMYGLGVPSKAYNILAAGIPILFIGDLRSEIALLIKENNIGYCFSNNDEAGILNFLDHLNIESLKDLEAMSQRARTLAETEYSEEIVLSKFMKVI